MQRTPMSVAQASEYTGYTKSALYGFMRARTIPYYKVGEGKRGKVIFAKEDIDEFLFAHRVGTEAELQEKASTRIAR